MQTPHNHKRAPIVTTLRDRFQEVAERPPFSAWLRHPIRTLRQVIADDFDPIRPSNLRDPKDDGVPDSYPFPGS